MGVKRTWWRTSLRWAEVFAWCRRARPSSARLLNAERPTLIDLSLESVLGCIRLFWGHHLHEAEAATLASMWVPHDVALFHRTVLLEETSNLLLVEAWVNACHEEVGAWVGCCRVLAAILVLV